MYWVTAGALKPINLDRPDGPINGRPSLPMSSKYNAEYRQVDCPFGKYQYNIVRTPAQLYPMIICITGAGAERGCDQEDCIAGVSAA